MNRDTAIDRESIVHAAESTWASNPAIRQEFVDNKASFIAYQVAFAEGRLRVLGKGDQDAGTASSAPPAGGFHSKAHAAGLFPNGL